MPQEDRRRPARILYLASRRSVGSLPRKIGTDLADHSDPLRTG